MSELFIQLSRTVNFVCNRGDGDKVLGIGFSDVCWISLWFVVNGSVLVDHLVSQCDCFGVGLVKACFVLASKSLCKGFSFVKPLYRQLK